MKRRHINTITLAFVLLGILYASQVCAVVHAATPPSITILSPSTAGVYRWPEDNLTVVANIVSDTPVDWITVQFIHPQTGELVGGTWSASGSMLNCTPAPCIQQTSSTTWHFQRRYSSVAMPAGLVGVQLLVRQTDGVITRSSITVFLLSLTMPTICVAPIR